jgi:hypothetical protein
MIHSEYSDTWIWHGWLSITSHHARHFGSTHAAGFVVLSCPVHDWVGFRCATPRTTLKRVSFPLTLHANNETAFGTLLTRREGPIWSQNNGLEPFRACKVAANSRLGQKRSALKFRNKQLPPNSFEALKARNSAWNKVNRIDMFATNSQTGTIELQTYEEWAETAQKDN